MLVSASLLLPLLAVTAEKCDERGYFLYNQDGEAQQRVFPMMEPQTSQEKLSSFPTGYEDAGKSVVFLYKGLSEVDTVGLAWSHNKVNGLNSNSVHYIEGIVNNLPVGTSIIHSNEANEFTLVTPGQAQGKWTFAGSYIDGGSLKMTILKYWKIKVKVVGWKQLEGTSVDMSWALLLGPGRGEKALARDKDLYIENMNVRTAVDGHILHQVNPLDQSFVLNIPDQLSTFSLVLSNLNRAHVGSQIQLQCCGDTACTFVIGVGRCDPCTSGKDGKLWDKAAEHSFTRLGCSARYHAAGPESKPETARLALMSRVLTPGEVVDLDPLPVPASRLAFFQKAGRHLENNECPASVGPFPPGQPCTVC